MSIECEKYYYGPTCSVYCNENLNGQNGDNLFKCLPDGRKLCKKGWNGALCDEPQCDHKCIHGYCIGPNQCRCDYGWKGPSCSECMPLIGCQHGRCRRPYECECYSNWSGKFCDIDLEFCARHGVICENGGSCIVDITNIYRCNCTNGFTGKHCEQWLDHSPQQEKRGCMTSNCEAGLCAITPTPRCETNSSNRVDFMLITLVLGIFAIGFAIIIFMIKFICEKLRVIQKMITECPFNYLINYATNNVSTCDEIRKNYGNETEENYVKPLRSTSPPPTYDTGQIILSDRVDHFIDEK
ncbi:EGF-like domain protein [Dictyocaulus viviparus]|uniref:Delta-like protein n=1 Tax=Dictyocaulus viviparus TaxID=29172 RepID=A0A0D8YC04_DICVI|nr:EGF-like domain protein [Dictyocaulus viviparus]